MNSFIFYNMHAHMHACMHVTYKCDILCSDALCCLFFLIISAVNRSVFFCSQGHEPNEDQSGTQVMNLMGTCLVNLTRICLVHRL